jgi:stage II sporulation protein D
MSHLQAVKCPYCKKSSLYRWKRLLTASTIAEKLKKAGYKVSRARKIKVVKGELRVKSVVVDGVSIPVNKFRAAVGFSTIWSNDFTVSKSGRKFVFKGKGAGHGVGVCQWGMAGMASAGKKYKEILKYYLKGIEIRKMY